MITLKELTKKTMPPKKLETAKVDIIGHYVWRPISNLITIPLLEQNVSATLVTQISCIICLIALIVFAFAYYPLCRIIAWFLILAWNILDGVDGNIARYTGTASEMGELWDAFGGYLAQAVFLLGMGLCAFYESSRIEVFSMHKEMFLFMGGISASAWLLARLVMHKKIGMLGKEAGDSLKKRGQFGLATRIVFNVTSINGVGGLLFLLAILTDSSDLCTILFFSLSVLIAFKSIISLFKQ